MDTELVNECKMQRVKTWNVFFFTLCNAYFYICLPVYVRTRQCNAGRVVNISLLLVIYKLTKTSVSTVILLRRLATRPTPIRNNLRVHQR